MTTIEQIAAWLSLYDERDGLPRNYEAIEQLRAFGTELAQQQRLAQACHHFSAVAKALAEALREVWPRYVELFTLSGLGNEADDSVIAEQIKAALALYNAPADEPTR